MRHLRQVKLLLLIWDLNVLMSFITERRVCVNILITSSCEEGLSVNFRLDVIWCWEYGYILLQSLINFGSLLSPFLLLIKLIPDGTVQFFAALFRWYARQLLLLMEWHLYWSFERLLLSVLVNFLGHHQWLIWLLLLLRLLLKLLVLLKCLDAADTFSWEGFRKGYGVKLLLEFKVGRVGFWSVCVQL